MPVQYWKGYGQNLIPLVHILFLQIRHLSEGDKTSFDRIVYSENVYVSFTIEYGLNIILSTFCISTEQSP